RGRPRSRRVRDDRSDEIVDVEPRSHEPTSRVPAAHEPVTDLVRHDTAKSTSDKAGGQAWKRGNRLVQMRTGHHERREQFERHLDVSGPSVVAEPYPTNRRMGTGVRVGWVRLSRPRQCAADNHDDGPTDRLLPGEGGGGSNHTQPPA